MHTVNASRKGHRRAVSVYTLKPLFMFICVIFLILHIAGQRDSIRFSWTGFVPWFFSFNTEIAATNNSNSTNEYKG